MSIFYLEIDDVSGVVLDIGSFNARGGYSGEDAPRMCTQSAVGISETEGKKDYFADDMLQIRRDKMAVTQVTDKNGYSIF